jgi:hypothetical protein
MGDDQAKVMGQKDGGQPERERQRAQALRDNLMRRKAQARNRKETVDEPTDGTGTDA